MWDWGVRARVTGDRLEGASRGSGGGVGQRARQLLVDQLLSGFLTAPATCAQTTSIRKMLYVHGAVIHGLADLGVGYSFAEADVHWIVMLMRVHVFSSMTYLNANRS